MMFRALSVAVLMVTTATSSATAGAVRGVVRIPAAAKATIVSANAYPGRAASLPQAPPTVRGEPADAVISIEKVSSAVESTLTQTARSGDRVPQMAQKGQAFVPRVL